MYMEQIKADLGSFEYHVRTTVTVAQQQQQKRDNRACFFIRGRAQHCPLMNSS